jgi:hypothetical protein
MSKTYDSIKLPYFNEGVIRTDQINDTTAPENSVELAINGNFDRIGAFQSRKGITAYATTLPNAVITLGKWAQNATTNRRLLAQSNNTIQSWDGATWTSVRSLSSGNKARYSQFLNLTYMVNGNGTPGDAVATFNGTTFGSTNVGSLPKGDYIQAGFEGRVWVADKSTDRLYYTDIVSPTGVIAGGTAYIEKLSPQDGQQITGLFRVPRALLVFKQDSIFRVYSATSLDPYPAYNVGTYSQESIVQAKDGVYFHHSSGFYKFSYDGQPQEVSRRIKDFVKAIPRANYEDVNGMYDGQDAINWSVGDITVGGVRFQRCILRYSISSQVWTIYDLSVVGVVKAMMMYDDGLNLVPVIATTHGDVAEYESGTTDLGAPIYYDLVTRWMAFTDNWASVKTFTGIYIITENAAGGTVMFQTDKSQPDAWQTVGAINEIFSSDFPNFASGPFFRIRFRVKGINSGTQVVIHGAEISKLKDTGFASN